MIEEEQLSPSQTSHSAPISIPRVVKPAPDEDRSGKTVTASTVVPNSTLKSSVAAKSKPRDEPAPANTSVPPLSGGHARTRSVGSVSSASTTSTVKGAHIDVTNVTPSVTTNLPPSSQQQQPDSPGGTGNSLAGRAADIVSSARDFLGAIWS